MLADHDQALTGRPAFNHVAHVCDFSSSVQKMMIEIVKCRNQASPEVAPDDFDPSLYIRPDPKSSKPTRTSPDSQPNQPSQADSAAPRPTHSPEGFLLSTSNRPGGSKYQYVQYKSQTQKYKVCIPHAGKRHSFGPFSTEIEAAKTVRDFLQSLQSGAALPTRGEKRTITYHHTLEEKLAELNITAKDDKRHKVSNAENPTCCFCQKSVHIHYALKFASQPCTGLTKTVDKRGSSTRAAKLSQTRCAVLQKDIDQHNCDAVAKSQHFIDSLDPPRCKFCQQTVTRGYVKKWMVRHCHSVPDPASSESKTSVVTKRLRGKQPATTTQV